jgi:hypothetical protein
MESPSLLAKICATGKHHQWTDDIVVATVVSTSRHYLISLATRYQSYCDVLSSVALVDTTHWSVLFSCMMLLLKSCRKVSLMFAVSCHSCCV